MGEKRRLAAAKLDGSTGMRLACFLTCPLTRERIQARGERGARGRKPPVLIPQTHLTPHEVLGFGVGEDDPAISGQQKDGETGGRDRRAERVGCCSRAGKEVMDRGRALQMRREGFQELPLLWFQRNRSGRSLKRQISGGNGRANKTNADVFGLSLRPHEFIVKCAGFETIGLCNKGGGQHLAWHGCQHLHVEWVYFVIVLDKCIRPKWINIIHGRNLGRNDSMSRPVDLMNTDDAANRSCRFDDALDDLVPTRRFDNGVVDCRDQIAAAV